MFNTSFIFFNEIFIYIITGITNEPIIDNIEVVKEFCNTDISTKKPSLSLKVTKTRVGEITYVVTTKDNYDLTSATLEVTITDNKIGEVRTITNNINISNNMSNTVKVDNVSDGDIIELKLINVKSGDTIIKDLTASDKFIY